MKIKVVETMTDDGSGVGKTYTIERVRKEGIPSRARIGDPAEVGGEASTADGNALQQQLEDVMGMGIAGDDLHDPSGEGPHGLGLISPSKAVDIDQYGIPGLLGEVHRHTLEESDRIKKSTVEREGIKRQKEIKKVQVSLTRLSANLMIFIAFLFCWMDFPRMSVDPCYVIYPWSGSSGSDVHSP
jgi:hypothetical protein